MKKYGEKKISPRFVPIEMAAIFDFMALTKIYITLKPVLQMQRKVAHTHRRHINEETYTSVLVLLNITFEIVLCVKNINNKLLTFQILLGEND